MNDSDSVFIRSPKADVPAKTEAEVRVELAACYRLLAHFGLDDLIFAHVAARVPGEEETFLINPYGLMYSEITASNLVKVHEDRRRISGSYPVNAFGFDIHRTLLRARPDATCTLHTHTTATIAVSVMEQGLMPISQFALQFYNNVGYHEYEGNSFNADEQERLAQVSQNQRVLLLRNHGIITFGRTVPEAFFLAYDLETACRIQVAALSANSSPVLPPTQLCEAMSRQYKEANYGELAWPALLRLLDRHNPGYRE